MDTITATCAILSNDGMPPEWVRLVALGDVRTRDGRKFTVEHPETIVAASQPDPNGVMPVIDFDHATDAKELGKPAPAAGWIAELQARDDGIYARIDWTEAGADAIAKRAYRYISPVFAYEKSGGQVLRILRAGLVNDPALEQIALAKREDQPMEYEELLKALRKKLGLGDDGDQTAILAAIDSTLTAGTAGDEFRTQVCKALDLAGDAKIADVATALAKRQDDADATAASTAGGEQEDVATLKATIDNLQKEVAGVKGERAIEIATNKVEASVEAGKITPDQKDWAIDYCTRDPKGFDAFIAKQPVIIRGGRQLSGDPPSGGDGHLTEQQKALCASTGVSEEKFLATLKADQAKQKEATQ